MALLAHRESTTEVLHCYTEQISVIYQLDNLLTYPAVRKRVEDGTLFLHGWHYNLEDGSIESYDDENFEFKPLSQK